MTPDVDIFKNPQGDLALAQEYMKKAGYASGKYTGKEKVLMVGVQEGVAQRNAEVAQQGLQSLGFNVNLRLVTQDAMYTKYCQVPKAKVAICPNLGWIKDYADPRTIIDPLWNPKNIVPSGNVNFSEYRDPAFQKEMDDAINMPTGDARVQAFAALDKKISNDLVLGVAYLWDKYPVVHSKNVQIVNQLWNQGSPDLSWTSLK
jgi:peptide/nickel transport system substrate-binding protein